MYAIHPERNYMNCYIFGITVWNHVETKGAEIDFMINEYGIMCLVYEGCGKRTRFRWFEVEDERFEMIVTWKSSFSVKQLFARLNQCWLLLKVCIKLCLGITIASISGHLVFGRTRRSRQDHRNDLLQQFHGPSFKPLYQMEKLILFSLNLRDLTEVSKSWLV